MKNLKTFENYTDGIENLNLRSPKLMKGKVLIYPLKNVSDDIIKDIAKKLGYEWYAQYDDSAHEISVPFGQEEQAGQDFIDNYPEFFGGSERVDLRFEYSQHKFDDIVGMVEDLRDNYIGYTDIRKNINKKNFNGDLDTIIEELNTLRI
tara:strand:- start:55893 stop:56339 length:447 start_codon:yes stop_codon:yes gene_type:complete